MKNKLAIAFAVAGALGIGGVVLAQVNPPLLATMGPTDLIKVIPQGNPGAGDKFVTARTLSAQIPNMAHGSTAPVLSSCGTGSPALATGSTDTSGIITAGAAASGCVMTFSAAYTNAPNCLLAWQGTPLASQSYTVSTTAVTITQTSTSANKINYLCIAQNGA